MKHEAIKKYLMLITEIEELIYQSNSMNSNAICAELITKIEELIYRSNSMNAAYNKMIVKTRKLGEKRVETNARYDVLINDENIKNQLNNIKTMYEDTKNNQKIWNALNTVIKLIEDTKKIDMYTKITESIKKFENINIQFYKVEDSEKYENYSALHFGMYLFFIF